MIGFIMHKHSVLSVAKNFSRFPAGRLKTDSNVSGEAFRELLKTKLEENDSVTVLLDGTMGFGSSWLEEAFGGLVNKDKIPLENVRRKLTIQTRDESLILEIWMYIEGE